MRENIIFRNQLIGSGVREVEHLASRGSESIGFEEITLMDYIKDLKNNQAIVYAFIINNRNEIIYSFDKETASTEDKLRDLTEERIISDYTKGAVKIYTYKSNVPGEEIYHFSIPFSSRVNKDKNPGIAVIGINSKSVHDNLINSIIEVAVSFLALTLISVLTVIFLYKKLF